VEESRGVTEWNDRFDAFVARKEAAALAVRLPGYLTVETPGYTLGLETVENEWTSRLFDGPFFESPAPDGRPAVNLVFVQSADRNTAAPNPADLGGGATDSHLIYEGLSRVRADAVMSGAGTVKGSQMVFGVWHPELVRLRRGLGLPRYPAQVVATRNGDLGIASELLFNVPDVPVFILTTAAGAAALKARVDDRPWISIIAAPEEAHLVGSLRRLHDDHGIRRISCIGGRTLATELIDAGVVQDIYLTTSARPGGEPGTPFYTGAAPLETTRVVKKVGRAEEAGVAFEHLWLGRQHRPESQLLFLSHVC
jgi:riboflavin biosynthesis pyrimidine reductase